MIPLAVPIAFAVVALIAWRYEARARRAYEATLSAAEKRQFRALRRVHPSKWRAAIALKQAEAAVTASQDLESRKPKEISQRPRRHAKRDTKKQTSETEGRREEPIE